MKKKVKISTTNIKQMQIKMIYNLLPTNYAPAKRVNYAPIQCW